MLLGLVCAVSAFAAEKTELPAHYDLNVRLTPQTRELAVQSTIDLEASGQLELTLGAQFEVDSLTIDGKPIPALTKATNDVHRWTFELGDAAATHRIQVQYHGLLEKIPESDARGVLEGLPAMASERGSFLPGGSHWYPELDNRTFSYRVKLELPAGQRGLVPGNRIAEETSGVYRAEFAFDHPVEGIDLMAGPYAIEQRPVTANAASVGLRTYFHPEIAELASDYLASSADYIKRYSASIGTYPYAEFSIVSSLLPTGFGMPTLTYLGIDVLRLPFIRATSLGHEVLHNWWGNGVFVDWQQGNWSEGLTTFMADYAFKEDQGESAARDLRVEWLRDFAALPVERDQPLRAFTSRTHDASQIVGYNKAAFLFFMLRDELGEPAFQSGIRKFWGANRFRHASWSDLQRAFETSRTTSLDAFFQQWLNRTGAPTIKIEAASSTATDTGFHVAITLAQSAPAYRLRVPLTLSTDADSTTAVVELNTQRQTFVVNSPSRVRTLSIDPDFRLFRRLSEAEIPQILRQVTLDPRSVTLLASQDPGVRAAARVLAERLMDNHVRLATDIKMSDNDDPVLVIGQADDVDRFLRQMQLPARPSSIGNRGTAQVWTAKLSAGKPLLVVSARDAAALEALQRPLPHYGRQSWLVFDGSKAIDRGIWPAQAQAWQFE
ncbi:MAG: M1 family aminopeptidase [Betaproteobacteria bacterium]